MKKILITGISGFVGSYLAEHFIQKGYTVSGTYLSDSHLSNLSSIQNKITLHKVDLTVKDKVLALIQEETPDTIFHLAALSSAAESFKDPLRTITTNVTAQIHLFDSVRSHNLTQARILVVSSAEVYGVVAKENLPIHEEVPLRPANPYAVSKIAQDFLALQYAISYKLPIIRVRPFSHIGPRQSPLFALASFAKRIAEIEKEKSEPVLKVGNLDARRDFTDVRDVVRAYELIIEKGEVGEVYNIGSGKDFSIREVLNKLLSLSSVKIIPEVDRSLFRPSDNPQLLCDPGKLFKQTGWKPEIPIDQSLRDTLDYWRNLI